MDDIEQQRQNIIEGARAEAEAELAILREEIQEIRKQLRAVPPTYRQEAEDAQRQLEDIAAEAEGVASLIDEPVQRVSGPEEEEDLEPAPEFEEVEPGDLSVGDIVFVSSLNQEGEILSLDGDAEVQVGQFRLRIDPSELEYRSRRQSKKAHSAQGGTVPFGIKRPRPESPGLELHLRGLTLDEALPDLEDYLDQAYLSGLPWVRIVHGKGTGVLRRGVRQTLERSPLVKSFKSAEPADGGDGVTVATFVPLN
jgi:DNA mismatch repair protein MutS2